jgi:hypothetical protein
MAESSGESASPSPRAAIGVLVLGMHRSGTSALARMLSLLGCALPRTLMAANPTNPAGHWESDAIAEFNDRLLASAGTDWADWLPVNPGWYRSPLHAPALAEGAKLLASEFGDASLFVLKDPRNCRLAGFWIEAMIKAGCQPAIVVPLRNPLEVAQSLHVRDGVDEGYALLMWLRHTLDAEAATRGRVRHFTHFDQLVNQPQFMMRRMADKLDLSWPRVSPGAWKEVRDFLDGEMRHHRLADALLLEDPDRPRWLRDAYAVLRRWSEEGEDSADYDLLDGISAALAEAAPAFADTIDGARHVGGALRALEARARDAEHRAMLNDAERIRLATELEEVRTLNELSAARQAVAEEARAVFAGETEMLRSALAAADQAGMDLEARAEALQQELDAQTAVVTQARSTFDAEIRMLREQQAKSQAADTTMRDLHEELSTIRQGQGDAIAARDEANALLRKAEADFAAAARERDVNRLAAERNEASAAAAVEQSRSLAAEVSALRAELQAAQHRLFQTESALLQRQEEIAQTRAELEGERDAALSRAAKLADEAARIEQARAAIAQDREAQRERLGKVEKKLIEADQWVFRLAGKRRDMEMQAARLMAQFERERRQRSEAERKLEIAQGRLIELAKATVKSPPPSPVSESIASAANGVVPAYAFELPAVTDEEHRRKLALLQEQVIGWADAPALTALSSLTGRPVKPAVRPEPELELAAVEPSPPAAALPSRATDYEAAERSAAERETLATELASARREAERIRAFHQEGERSRQLMEERIRQEEATSMREIERAQWLMQYSQAAAVRGPWWWDYMPRRWRRSKLMGRLRRRGLFDAEAYLVKNPDVAADGLDPLDHYIGHGLNENRSIW